jgi:hypothetical protein
MTRKILLSVLLIFLIGLKVFPQKKLYDIVYFDEPGRWKKDERPVNLTYTFTNNVRGTYGMIVIYPSIKSSGDAGKDLLNSWNMFVRPAFGAGIMPISSKTVRDDGYQVLVTSDELDIKGKRSTVRLMDFTGYGRTVTFIINYTDKSYEPAIDAFLKTVSFKEQEVKK